MADETTGGTAVVEEVAQDRPMVDLLKPDTCPASLKKFYTDIEREQIAAAVASGDIVTETKNVKISKKKTKSKDELWPFLNYKAVTQRGMSALSGGRLQAAKEKPENYDQLTGNEKVRVDNSLKDGAADYFNYGFILTITQPIRVMMTSRVGMSPEQEIDKQVAQVMKTGLFADADTAKAFVVAQRKTMNMRVPDAFADEDETEEATA
jgi:hypothetical protein